MANRFSRDCIDMLLAYPFPTKDSPAKLTPLSILFPGVLFKSQGLRVAYYDQRFDSQAELDDLILQSKEIAVSAMTGSQCAEAAKLLLYAKRLKPKIIASVGGPHARFMSEDVKKEPFVDKVYPNLAYGEELCPFDEQTQKHFARTEMMYFTSLGCQFGCRFCSQSSAWRPLPMQRLDRELSMIHNAVGFKNVAFCDQNITHPVQLIRGKTVKVDTVQRIRDLGSILRRLNVTWSGSLRCPDLSKAMVDALVFSGANNLHVGCESGSERVLRQIIRKGHGLDAIREAVMNVRGHGLSVLYSFIAGMPGEKKEDALATMDLIDWIMETDRSAKVSVYHYTPYPGTSMYDDAISGRFGFPVFSPPRTMIEWGNMALMASPIYWIAGLCFRQDNSRKNFPGNDWLLIEPYIKLAQKKWRSRDIAEFPCDEVSMLIERQVRKWDAVKVSANIK